MKDEARRLRDEITDPDCTGWTCPTCGWSQYHAYGFECDCCGFEVADMIAAALAAMEDSK